MKIPEYHPSTTSQAEEVLPVALRWTLVGLFVLFSIVNLDWKHVATAIFALVQLHSINIQDFLQGSCGTGDAVGGLELLTAGFLSFRGRGTRGYAPALAQAISLVTFVVIVVLLSSRFQLDSEVFGPNITPRGTGGGFFIKDLLLTAFTLSVLAIADLWD